MSKYSFKFSLLSSIAVASLSNAYKCPVVNLDNSNSMYDGEYIKYEFGSNDYNITPTTTIYNLTHNIIQRNSGAIVDASVDDKIEMYQHLITANAYAAQVTLDNVSKGYSYSKK